MLGLGKWKCRIKTFLFSGEAVLEIYDNNGEYGFRAETPDIKCPEIIVKRAEAKGDILTATVQVDALPGKDITAELKFSGDSFDAAVKVPVLGKVKVKNCTRISE